MALGPNPRIFLDMDAVLCDWAGAVLRACGMSMPDPWPENCDNLFTALERSGCEKPKTTIWNEVNSVGREFWATLDPLPWAHDLWFMCQDLAPTTILSTPSHDPESLAGKIDWLQGKQGLNEGRKFRHYLLGAHKHVCARPDAILIDDSTSNVENFRDCGGKAILFPAMWNDNRNHLIDPLSYVRDELLKLL